MIVDVRLATVLALNFLVREVRVSDGRMVVLVPMVAQQMLDFSARSGMGVVRHVHVIVAVHRCVMAVLLESFAWHGDSFPMVYVTAANGATSSPPTPAGSAGASSTEC